MTEIDRSLAPEQFKAIEAAVTEFYAGVPVSIWNITSFADEDGERLVLVDVVNLARHQPETVAVYENLEVEMA